MNDTKYNGWANYETWLCNLWYDGLFEEDAAQFEEINDLADYIKEYVTEQVDAEIPANGFVADLVGAALSEVDWYEIAEHYEEFMKKDEVENEEV